VIETRRVPLKRKKRKLLWSKSKEIGPRKRRLGDVYKRKWGAKSDFPVEEIIGRGKGPLTYAEEGRP